MLDAKIIGGTIVDGTGKPGFVGDLGIRDGRIVAVGAVSEDAAEVIDATSRVVSPGFVDAHTHYDAQVFWDPRLSPSCYHGVTTAIGGFCGFSIAPLTAESAPYIRRMLSRVEGQPYTSGDLARLMTLRGEAVPLVAAATDLRALARELEVEHRGVLHRDRRSHLREQVARRHPLVVDRQAGPHLAVDQGLDRRRAETARHLAVLNVSARTLYDNFAGIVARRRDGKKS